VQFPEHTLARTLGAETRTIRRTTTDQVQIRKGQPTLGHAQTESSASTNLTTQQVLRFRRA
jgi:hypothetical protein